MEILPLILAGLLAVQAESPGRLVDQLGSDDESVRLEAAKKLEALGQDAIDELKSAILHCKPRTAALAQKTLDAINVKLAPARLAAIQNRLMKPKTCRFDGTVVVRFRREKNVTHRAWAEVYFSGEKVRVDSLVEINGEQDSRSWICTGKSAWRRAGEGEWQQVPAVSDIRAKTVAAVLGLYGPDAMPWMDFDFPKGPAPATLGVPEVPRTPDFTPCLHFEVEENPGSPNAYAMIGTLRYDDSKFLPQACEWSKKRDKRKAPERGEILVSYRNIVLDGEVDEKLFSP